MEILSQEDMLVLDPSYARVALVFFIAFLGAGVLGLILVSFSDFGSSVASSLSMLFCVIFMLILIRTPRIDSGRDRYEVILDETIDINEFYDEYEVIERRDKILVIEDKENVE